jgi:hypothetical protein
MIAIEDLRSNSTFEDNCGHLFVLKTFSVCLVLGQDGKRRPTGTATLERLALGPNEKPLTVTIPIDGVPLLRKIADHDLSVSSPTETETRFSHSDAA